MGKRGPRPEPTALKIIKGARPDRINTREPKPTPTERHPSCPAWVPAYGKREWRRLAPLLWKSGRLLTEWDREAFAVYCTAVATHKAAVEEVYRKDTPEILVYTEHGRAKHPALQIVRDSAQTIRAFAQEFGLTPSARASLKTDEAPPDELARLLS